MEKQTIRDVLTYSPIMHPGQLCKLQTVAYNKCLLNADNKIFDKFIIELDYEHLIERLGSINLDSLNPLTEASKSDPEYCILDYWLSALSNALEGVEIPGRVYPEYSDFVKSRGKGKINYKQASYLLQNEGLPKEIKEIHEIQPWIDDMQTLLDYLHKIRSAENALYQLFKKHGLLNDELKFNHRIFCSHLAYETALSQGYM